MGPEEGFDQRHYPPPSVLPGLNAPLVMRLAGLLLKGLSQVKVGQEHQYSADYEPEDDAQGFLFGEQH